jgi:hypothetical protein
VSRDGALIRRREGRERRGERSRLRGGLRRRFRRKFRDLSVRRERFLGEVTRMTLFRRDILGITPIILKSHVRLYVTGKVLGAVRQRAVLIFFCFCFFLWAAKWTR